MTEVKTCSACNYTRQLTDYAPGWECPKCQKAYAKTTQSEIKLELAVITDRPEQQNIELIGIKQYSYENFIRKQNLFIDQYPKGPGMKHDYAKDISTSFAISCAMYVFLRIATQYADITVGILIILTGVLFFVYRHSIGNATDYYVGHGRWVDKPTPGWMLIPFALVIIAIGAMGLFAAFSSTKPTYVPHHSLPQYRVIPDELMR